MALIVEDGTAKPDAESYISVVDATAYHSARGNAAWAAVASDTVREQLLRKATDYITQTYRLRWAGSRVTIAQALDWPRAWMPMIDTPSPYQTHSAYIAQNVVPIEVTQSCAELALSAISGPLAPALTRAKASVTVGPISVTYDPASPEVTRFRIVDMRLLPYLIGGSQSAKLVRA